MELNTSLVTYSDFILEKPTYLRSIINLVNSSETSINITLGNAELKANIINEYFVNKDKTLISCNANFSENPFIEAFLGEMAIYFYKPSHLNLENGFVDKITIFSPFFRNISNNKQYFESEEFDIIPLEDRVIINFLIDNSVLSKSAILKY
jgi:hypothetical protein